MPIYEYLCKDCGKRFEMVRAINEADTPIPCNSCQSSQTQRTLSVFFAKSGSHIIASSSNGGCSGCAGNTCSTCNTN